jgi:Response regulator receiver domain
MQDRDAAYTLPGEGNPNVWNEETAYSARVIAKLAQNQVGEPDLSRRILIVEDDPSLANLEAGILVAHGYMVAIARNGEIAIAALQQALPDLVLLDLELSGAITGWDVLHANSCTWRDKDDFRSFA